MNNGEKVMLKLFLKKLVIVGVCVGVAYFIEKSDRIPFED